LALRASESLGRGGGVISTPTSQTGGAPIVFVKQRQGEKLAPGRARPG
jgi:hypothetical protein